MLFVKVGGTFPTCALWSWRNCMRCTVEFKHVSDLQQFCDRNVFVCSSCMTDLRNLATLNGVVQGRSLVIVHRL